MKASITYCSLWNYKPQAARLAAKMKQALGIEPALIPEGGGKFEVVVEGELVYSKMKTGSFPDMDQLINELVAAHGTIE